MTYKPKKTSVNKSTDMIDNDYGFNVKAMDDYLGKMRSGRKAEANKGAAVYGNVSDKIKDNKYADTMIKIGKSFSDFGKYNHLNDLYYIDNPTGADEGYKYINKEDMNKYFYALASHEKGDTDKKDVDALKHYLFRIGEPIDKKDANELPPIKNKPDYSKISSEEQLIYDSFGNAVNKAKSIDYSKVPTDDQLPKEPGKVKVDKSTEAVDRDYGLDLSSYKDMMSKNKSDDTDKPKKPIDYSKISSDEQLIYDSYGNAINKAKGIDYSDIPTDDQFADDAKDKAIDKAKGIDYNKIYDSYGFDVSSDYDKQDKIDAEVRDYLKRSAKQVVYGNYTDDVTALGTAGQIGLGLTGLDFAADIRDLVYDFSNWEWSGKHIGQTLLDLVGLVPGIGVVKNLDEAAGLVKNVIKNSDLAEKTAKNVLDKVDEFMPALKRSMDSPSIAPLLGNIMKSSDEAAGIGKKVVKSGDEVKEGLADASKGAGKASHNITKPYAKSRPSYGKTQVDDVWNNYKDPTTGKAPDPAGGSITWDKTKPRRGQWDMGHIPGEKYSDIHDRYINGEITQKEFLEWYRNPANYRPELPSTNRSHRYE
ncbi:MAG: hypothetical protein GYA50_09475 [Eubacteriaceae bacterium]|nr:hypothetical protein [Eubacteriaceae bacterium]